MNTQCRRKIAWGLILVVLLSIAVPPSGGDRAVAAEKSVTGEQIPAADPSGIQTSFHTTTSAIQIPSPSPVSETEPPSPTPDQPRLKKVSRVRLVRYSTHEVKVTWKRYKKAKYYRVYYSKKRDGKFRLAGVTKKDHLLVKKLKNKTKYYFYVQAGRKRKVSPSDSPISKKVGMKMKTYSRKTIFAGDSICQGIGYGATFSRMHIGGRKKTVAYRGLNTITFHTKRVFGGRTGLQRVIAEKPYRVYMMLGMNEIHGRPAKQIIPEYRDLIKSIQQASPNTDIVLCAVSPVTRGERARKPGMWQIPKFNKMLKKLAKKCGVRYFNYTGFLKDSQGYLKAQYSAGDGYHWNASAYTKFAAIVEKYDKSLDR